MEGNMRQEVHNTLARFRVNDALLATASDRARRDGMTLSEFIRAAIRREVRN
jgi:antitoxin component of RelBE/YafQ-DinJ toxin-antitoxin module